MPRTALDLITSSLRLINVVASGEIVDIDIANDSLQVLNDMIDSWNAQRLAIFTTRSDDFPFVLNKQAYTLGTGGDFNIPRPARIDAISAILLTPNPSNPIEVPITMFSIEDWQMQVPVKEVFGSFPQICYDTGDFPLRTLNFWPIPNIEPTSVRIYSWQAIAAQTLTTQVSFPPGYAEAIRYQLAVRLGAEFAATIPAIVTTIAVQSFATVKTMNAPEAEMRSDLLPDPQGWNWSADLFGNPYQ